MQPANKLDFFQWYANQERGPNDPPLTPEQQTEWIRSFVVGPVWKSYSTGQAVHDGDCINMPYACNLCVLEQLLKDYSWYVFDE